MPGRSPGPSIKDKKLYETLRDEGNSKEKSARIANASAARGRRAVASKGGSSGDYAEMTVSQLHKRAAEIGIHGRSTMNKRELINALRHH
jgi:hypothetical protein